MAAFDKEQLVSLGIAQIINNYDYYLPFDSEINKKLENKTVGSFSTLCALESYQGKGIGQKISHKRLEWLKSKDCTVVVGVSWVSGLAHTSNRVFEKMGFKAIKEVKNFYRQNSIDKPFICPGCAKPPCTCSAILYMREI